MSVTESGPPKPLTNGDRLIPVIELVISLPAPKTKVPLVLAALFATPTMALAIPALALLAVADSMEFKVPLIVAPKFLGAFVGSPP